MKFDAEQAQIVRWSGAAIALTIVTLGAGLLWIPPSAFGVGEAISAGDRLAFTLKWELPVLLWLAGCVRAVASQRFREPADRRGAAYGEPTTRLAVRAAILQNSLEQTVLAIGAHLILATVLVGPELVLIPLLVLLHLAGRVAFALSYHRGAGARAFGMALTGAAAIAGYGIAIALMVAGR